MCNGSIGHVPKSCQSPAPVGEPDLHQHIRFNQVGYYPTAVKEFVVADYEATAFVILDEEGEEGI